MNNTFFSIIFSVSALFGASCAHADFSTWLRNKNYARMEYFVCEQENHFCARALEELQNDFAAQQEVMQSNIDFFIRNAMQNSYKIGEAHFIKRAKFSPSHLPELFKLKKLHTIYVDVYHYGIIIKYDFDLIPCISDASRQEDITTLMLEPYGPLLAHTSFVLSCGRSWAYLYPYARSKKIALDDQGNYAYMHLNEMNTPILECTVKFSLTAEQKLALDAFSIHGKEKALKHLDTHAQ